MPSPHKCGKFPFPLVVDSDGKVATAFGVDRIPIVDLFQRQPFLVKNEKIDWVGTKAKTSSPADEVRHAVAELKE